MTHIIEGHDDTSVLEPASITPLQHSIPEPNSKSINLLPTFPFELQLAILSQIPPVQLFTLRRVSRSWNSMLQNPLLLEEINNQLPYLTSAPDLTSRMKRRMRMIRKKPVWIKKIPELFPGAQETITDHDNWWSVRFWDGWAVLLIRSRGFVRWDCLSTLVRNPVLRLRIEGLRNKARSYPGVDVDVLAEFKRVDPRKYREYFKGNDAGPSFDKNMLLRLVEFSIQDGKIVVILEGKAGSEPAIDWKSEEVYT